TRTLRVPTPRAVLRPRVGAVGPRRTPMASLLAPMAAATRRLPARLARAAGGARRTAPSSRTAWLRATTPLPPRRSAAGCVRRPGSPVAQLCCLLLFAPGTPAPPGARQGRPTLILQGVNFQTGRSVLTRESYAVLEQVAASLVANPQIRIEIAGYTDSTGGKMMNLRLSMGRAGAVQHYLARKGVSPLRMRARGFGASG